VKLHLGHSNSDEALYRMVMAGDRVALELLYERYFRKLVWFAGNIIKDEDEAKDVVQETFIKVITKPDLFDASRKFSTWIYTVVGNACRNHIRDQQNRLRILRENLPDEAQVEKESNHDKKILQQSISSAIGELSPKEQQLYRLRFEEEMAISEIAAVVCIPEGSVKSGLFYLVKKISKQLKAFEYEQ